LVSISHADVEDLRDVSEYLISLKKYQLYKLGVALGLHTVPTLDNIQDSPTFLYDMLTSWLQGQDSVNKRGGHTWGALVNALRQPTVAENEVADKIQREKCQGSQHAVSSPHYLHCPYVLVLDNPGTCIFTCLESIKETSGAGKQESNVVAGGPPLGEMCVHCKAYQFLINKLHSALSVIQPCMHRYHSVPLIHPSTTYTSKVHVYIRTQLQKHSTQTADTNRHAVG